MLSQKSLLVGLTVLVLTILNIDQGFALKCYECNSVDDKNCTSDFKKPNYEKNCIDIKKSWVEFKNNLPDAETNPKPPSSFECVEIKEFKDAKRNTTDVLRTCMPAGLSPKYLKESFSLYGVTVKTVNICGKDLCNSSSNVYAGISSLVFSIVLLFLVK